MVASRPGRGRTVDRSGCSKFTLHFLYLKGLTHQIAPSLQPPLLGGVTHCGYGGYRVDGGDVTECECHVCGCCATVKDLLFHFGRFERWIVESVRRSEW